MCIWICFTLHAQTIKKIWLLKKPIQMGNPIQSIDRIQHTVQHMADYTILLEQPYKKHWKLDSIYINHYLMPFKIRKTDTSLIIKSNYPPYMIIQTPKNILCVSSTQSITQTSPPLYYTLNKDTILLIGKRKKQYWHQQCIIYPIYIYHPFIE